MWKCAFCERRIWPWQHFGWRVKADGTWQRWHTSCFRIVEDVVEDSVKRLKR